MASPHEKLAKSLAVLRVLQEPGIVAVRSADLDPDASGTLGQKRLLARGHEGLVHPRPPGRGRGREHGMVRSVLAFLCNLFKGAFWDELESLS